MTKIFQLFLIFMLSSAACEAADDFVSFTKSNGMIPLTGSSDTMSMTVPNGKV